MSRRPNPALIGAFVVGAVALVTLAVVVFGSGRLSRHTRKFVLYFQGSVNGLEKGAPVKFRGVPIGAVTDILLAVPEKPGETRIPVFIEIDQDRLSQLGATRVTNDPAVPQRLIDLGLRGQLQLQSLITGVLFIGLDMFPGSPADLVLPQEAGYQEIPTLPTSLEQAQAKIQDVLARLSRIDFEALSASVTSAVAGVDRLVNSPETQGTMVALHEALGGVREAAATFRSQVGPLAAGVNGTTEDARVTLKQLDATLAKITALTDPQAPLVYRLTGTLASIDDAARAVRALAQNLDRNPSVILTGRKAP